MPGRKTVKTGASDDFRELLDVKFNRVDEKLDSLASGLHAQLKQQDDDRKEQFKKIEARVVVVEKKVDDSDHGYKIVGGISAGAGGVFGVAIHYLWSKLSGH